MAKDKIPEEKLAELKAKHGDVVVVDTKCGDCAFRGANKGEYDRYQALLFKEATRPKAGETLVLATLVYPDSATFAGYVQKFPGVVTTCTSPVLELSGVDGDADVKKHES
jgi:hypothetical protein